ncbi:MAG: response regulator [Acidobacteriota bacterium]|nr:response regulator [Acidobacteriota bacterium]
MSVAESYFDAVDRAAAPTVLIAEDERKLRQRLVDQLTTNFGIAPYVATTGYEAIKLADEHRPELILLDGLLPEMHGFEVARFIRRLDDGYYPHIAIVTAIYKQVRYHNEARLKYGINDYIVKPVSDDALNGVVMRASQRMSS